LELKTRDLREVGDVGEVVVSEAVDAAGITSAQNCEDAFGSGRGGPTQVNGIFDRSMESARFKFGPARLAAHRHAA
jgi:hypothetical protein